MINFFTFNFFCFRKYRSPVNLYHGPWNASLFDLFQMLHEITFLTQIHAHISNCLNSRVPGKSLNEHFVARNRLQTEPCLSIVVLSRVVQVARQTEVPKQTRGTSKMNKVSQSTMILCTNSLRIAKS